MIWTRYSAPDTHETRIAHRCFCDACDDGGVVMLPVLDYFHHHQYYLGHGGQCEDHCDCKFLPNALRQWLGQHPDQIPDYVLTGLETGWTRRCISVGACPLPDCENGKVARVYYRNFGKNGKPFKRLPDKYVTPDSPEGQKLIRQDLARRLALDEAGGLDKTGVVKPSSVRNDDKSLIGRILSDELRKRGLK